VIDWSIGGGQWIDAHKLDHLNGGVDSVRWKMLQVHNRPYLGRSFGEGFHRETRTSLDGKSFSTVFANA
jgi:hypothetical protein